MALFAAPRWYWASSSFGSCSPSVPDSGSPREIPPAPGKPQLHNTQASWNHLMTTSPGPFAPAPRSVFLSRSFHETATKAKQSLLIAAGCMTLIAVTADAQSATVASYDDVIW